MSKHGPRVRVTYDDLRPGELRQSKEKIGWALMRAFKKARQDYGIEHMIKEHEYYMSKGQKRRQRALREKLDRVKREKEKKDGVAPQKFEWEENNG